MRSGLTLLAVSATLVAAANAASIDWHNLDQQQIESILNEDLPIGMTKSEALKEAGKLGVPFGIDPDGHLALLFKDIKGGSFITPKSLHREILFDRDDRISSLTTTALFTGP